MKFLIATMLIASFNLLASIEYVPEDHSKASSEQIATNRACFKDLHDKGCPDPADAPAQFRSCMVDVFRNLDGNCQNLMRSLYTRQE